MMLKRMRAASARAMVTAMRSTLMDSLLAACGLAGVWFCELAMIEVSCISFGKKKNPRIAIYADTWVPEVSKLEFVLFA